MAGIDVNDTIADWNEAFYCAVPCYDVNQREKKGRYSNEKIINTPTIYGSNVD